ncbi:MAG TPA: D-amino acid dehydrogenase [Alphaproteobacteria bacterium]|nr:D-amino acid dehydrogenase [Alphaproteobacteria bacterium]
MKTIVLGAGVVGVTTAYYLAKAGHQVVVIDRQSAAAAETSYANAGLIAPGHSFTWNSPRAPKLLLQSIWRKDLAYRMHFSLDPRFWIWGLKFLRACTAGSARANTLIKLRLCRYSQAKIEEIAAAEGLSYHQYKKGLLYFYRDPEHFQQGIRNMTLMQEQGQTIEIVDARRCVEIEPALKPIESKLAGAIYCPNDGSGDCNLFTLQLAERCRRLGVEFRFETPILGLEARGGRIAAVRTEKGPVAGDAYVLSLGSFSPIVARSAGLDLPVYPVKGFSLTLPIDPALAPTVGGVDEGSLVAYCGMGDRLRMTATADFSGYDNSHRPEDFATMMAVARELFPKGVDFSKPRYWSCLRPMTPDGPPIIGASPIANLWLNTGQGHMGWTMSCGSSRVLADLMLGRQPEIATAGLDFARYGNGAAAAPSGDAPARAA